MASFAARVVCGPCNNGWMSALESRAQSWLTSMIAGHTTTLTPAAQMDLAAWVAMKAFVVEYALSAENEIVATPHDRRGLMDTGHPLGAVQVRVGAVERDGIPNSVRRIVYNVDSKGGPHGLAACTTFALGCAVLQVCYGLGITIDWRKTSRPGVDYVPLNPPCPGYVSWPPPVVLNASSLADLGEAHRRLGPCVDHGRDPLGLGCGRAPGCLTTVGAAVASIRVDPLHCLRLTRGMAARPPAPAAFRLSSWL